VKPLTFYLFGDCLGLASTKPKVSSVFLAVAVEVVSKSRIGFSTNSAQSIASHDEEG